MNWEFLDYMLVRMSFEEKWRKWVRCTFTTSFADMVNGWPPSFFRATRVVLCKRSVIPIFIIIVEALNKIIPRAREFGMLVGLEVDNGEHVEEITHLFFVDDTLLFWS